MIETRGKKRATAGAQPTGRGRTGRFLPKSSGNPAGRPKGSRNKTTLAAQALFDGEAEALTRKTIELPMSGDPAALRLCLERIIPRREGRLVEFTLPQFEKATQVASAMATVTRAVAAGMLTPGEGETIARMLETHGRLIERAELGQRVGELENKVQEMEQSLPKTWP